jgi:hypothetical protein
LAYFSKHWHEPAVGFAAVFISRPNCSAARFYGYFRAFDGILSLSTSLISYISIRFSTSSTYIFGMYAERDATLRHGRIRRVSKKLIDRLSSSLRHISSISAGKY